MHRRNRYNGSPPDFAALCAKYPALAAHSTTKSSGKVALDFHNTDTVRELTKALLDTDFGLQVELPPDHLIPTVNSRLNYLHWVEDLLALPDLGAAAPAPTSLEGCRGIDIGVGASCIYPLLGVRLQPSWTWVGTEVDPVAFAFAQANVQRNSLEDRIALVPNADPTKLLDGVVDMAGERFAFCMCNPPFFDKAEKPQNRSGHRLPPKMQPTASASEARTEGGEVEFVGRLIADSRKLGGRVRWYTSMLGKKASIKPLLKQLDDLGFGSVRQTVLAQGKTFRWAIAWSHGDYGTDADDEQPGKKVQKRRKVTKDRKPLQREFQCSPLELHSRVSKILGEELKCTVTPGTAPLSLHAVAHARTWANQRRKKRQMERGLASEEVIDVTNVVVEFDVASHPVAGGKALLSCAVEDDQARETLHRVLQFLINKLEPGKPGPSPAAAGAGGGGAGAGASTAQADDANVVSMET